MASLKDSSFVLGQTPNYAMTSHEEDSLIMGSMLRDTMTGPEEDQHFNVVVQSCNQAPGPIGQLVVAPPTEIPMRVVFCRKVVDHHRESGGHGYRR
jgi:hypothetical protein